jgi:zinc/manganese transport system substrate-binding protein
MFCRPTRKPIRRLYPRSSRLLAAARLLVDRRHAAALLMLCSAAVLAACNSSGPRRSAAGPNGEVPRFTVVAAENFWGSLAAQLAGGRASVRSIIVDPGVDPHSYEPTAADARAFAGASVAIVNGVGYDNWASQLLSGSSGGGRVVLDVGTLLGLPGGANPHRWYYPADVVRVIDAIVADYDEVDPQDVAYFAARRRWLLRQGFARYDRLRAQIRHEFAGTPVGYSESIFEGLGEDLDLRLLTPYSFAKAIAEGTDVTAADKQTVDAQVQRRQIAVWVQNSQNVTPDVERVAEGARHAGIPVATVTETLDPAGASFEQWQSAQLEELQRSLRAARGRGL